MDIIDRLTMALRAYRPQDTHRGGDPGVSGPFRTPPSGYLLRNIRHRVGIDPYPAG